MKLILSKINPARDKPKFSGLPLLVFAFGLFSAPPIIFSYTSGLSVIGTEQLGFVVLGMIGAVFANSTGAGGGVVFIPMFAELGLSEAQAVATSFGIQCFGMTAGAITWIKYHSSDRQFNRQSWQNFAPIIGLCSLFSILGIWQNYGFDLTAPAALNTIFSSFSLLLGLSLLVTIYLSKRGATRHQLGRLDILMLPFIAFIGGIITAWLSVGVGELVAFYLILRRFDATMAVAAAVVVSAISVWSATPHHLQADSTIQWQVLAFAGPGAILGGIAARSIVSKLSARRLKIFFAIWLLIIGLAS